MSSEESDRNQGAGDQSGFLNNQARESSSAGVDNWQPPQQPSNRYSDWGQASEHPQQAGQDSGGNVNFQPQQGNSAAITGFVLALVAGLLFLFPVINIILSIPAIVFSAIGLNKSNKEGRPRRGLAIAGLVISLLVLLLGIILLVAIGAWVMEEYESSSIAALTMLAGRL